LLGYDDALAAQVVNAFAHELYLPVREVKF